MAHSYQGIACHSASQISECWFTDLSSVQFSRSIVSDSSRPREWQHARPPCPSPTPGVHSDSCPSSQWCHPAMPVLRVKFFMHSTLNITKKSVMPSSHLILCRPLLLLPPIPPSIRVFYNESTLHMRWPKYWSFSFSIIPSKEIPGLISFTMDWLDLLPSKGLSRVFSNTTVQKHRFFGAQPSSQSNSHIHTWPQEKP